MDNDELTASVWDDAVSLATMTTLAQMDLAILDYTIQ